LEYHLLVAGHRPGGGVLGEGKVLVLESNKDTYGGVKKLLTKN